jgi:hypothetical protein
MAKTSRRRLFKEGRTAASMTLLVTNQGETRPGGRLEIKTPGQSQYGREYPSQSHSRQSQRARMSERATW